MLCGIRYPSFSPLPIENQTAMQRHSSKRLLQLLAGQQQGLAQPWACLGAVRLQSSAAGLPNSKDGKVLHPDLMNENMRKTQYAVRGELYLKAEELRKAGKEIIFTNGA